MKTWNTILAVTVGLMLAGGAFAEDKPQSKCPITGGAISKTVCVDVNGYRIYACCNGCIGKIKDDPDKAIAAIKANGETPEKAPDKK